MKRLLTRVVLPSIVVLAVVAVVMGRAASQGEASDGYTVHPGTAVDKDRFGPISRHRLAALGIVDVWLLGASGDRSYYKLKRASGHTCYAAAERTSPPSLLDIACLYDLDEMPTPVIDMSGTAVDPATGRVVRIAQVEGIASDQVTTVGIEVGGQVIVTTNVMNNVYRFHGNGLPQDAEAVVALDKQAQVVWRKPLRH